MITISMTADETKVQKTFQDIAKEPIQVEILCGCYYGFGSELAVLRLFAKYQSNGKHHNPRASIGYSEPNQSHYFCLEPRA